MPPAAASFPPPEDPNPGWYLNTKALLSCPCASIYPQMSRRCYNSEEVSVCQINGKTYWTGTIMQTNEIIDQLCPEKNQALPVGSIIQVTELSPPLDPRLYQVLNATHCLLNGTSHQLARDCQLHGI